MLSIAKPLSLRALQTAPVPDRPAWPGGSTRWKPVRHADLAHAVLDGARRRGLLAAEHHWTLTRHGHDLLGTIRFEADDRWPEEVVPAIALRHSNVGRHAVTLAIGAVVGVCSNGLLIGEVVVKHRHTCGIDLEDLVARGLHEFSASGSQTQHFIDRLVHTPLPPAAQAQIMLQAARDGAVPWSLLRRVDEALADPPDARMAEPSAWGLYNAFTEAIKRRSATGQYASLRVLSDLFSESSMRQWVH